MSNKKHPSDSVNGLSSPSKVQKMNDDDGRVARMKDMLSKGGGGMPGLLPPKPKPKPKAKPKPVSVAAASQDHQKDAENSAPPPVSPGDHMDDLPEIVLNTDSLRQFSETLDYDFDVVTRHQILDSSAQKDRAALSQSKGLQNRRLPSNVAGKVPEDYSERRRAYTYSGKKQSSPSPQVMDGHDSVDGISPEISEDERKQRNLAKLGVQQSNNPLAALGSILKRNGSGRGSFSRKKKAPVGSPATPQKSKKKTSLDVTSSPISTRLGSEPPQSSTPASKSPKGFLRGLRRNSSKKKKEGEDMASETSSIVSLPIHSTLDETPEPMDTTPAVTPAKSTTSSSIVTSASTSALKENGGFSPAHTSSPRLVPLRDKGKDKPSSTSFTNRKTTDSAIFKEGSYEHLFGDDSNLFDSNELDAFFKKKEKTPERKIEEEPADDIPDKAPSPVQKKTVTPITPVIPIPKKKHSVDSPRSGGMRANLHRYESNSTVSKTDTAEFTTREDPKPAPIPEDTAPPKSPTSDDPLTADKPSITDALSTKKDINSPSRKPKVGDSPLKKPKVPSPSRKAKIDDAASPKKVGIEGTPTKKMTTRSPETVKKTLLFEDDGDDLFGPVKSEPTAKKSSDEKAIDIKKASLFSDDSDELFADKPVMPVKTTPKSEPADESADDTSTKESAVKKEEEIEMKDSEEIDVKKPEITTKTSHDLFGDSIEDFDAKEADKKTDSPKKEDTTKVFGDTPLFKDIVSDSKHSDLFDGDDDDGIFSSQRRLRRNQKESPLTKKKDDSLFGDIDTSPTSSPKAKPKAVTATEVDVSDPLGAMDMQVTKASKKPEETESDLKVEAPAIDAKEEAPVMKVTDEKTVEDTKEEKPVKSDTDLKVLVSKDEEVDSTKSKAPPKAEKAKPSEDGEDGKPSWMAELKKRKQTKSGDPPSVAPKKKEPVEAPMPEWKKKALERKKKAESGGVSPKPGRASPTKPPKSPVKTAGNKSPLSERKLAASTDSPSSRPKYKTRQEREREAKERKEREEREMEEIRARYKTKRQQEREERERQRKEREEKKEESSPYKTRREREKEAKEKEEKAKEDSTTKSAESKPKEKPPLARKPSIEVITKKTSTSSSKSFDATDEGKPTRKDSEGSKKEADDDVFTMGDTTSEQRPASTHSLRRTPSPMLSIELLSTVVDPPKPSKDVVENGHDAQTKTTDDPEAKKTNAEVSSSPSPAKSTQNGSHSDKSSVSSEHDLTEHKPYRSHSQSMSVSSRSPTPPLVPSSSNSIPEWKRQLMERKKSSSSPVHKMAPKAVETPSADAGLPQWKKELLAKKKAKPDNKDATPRSTRSATVATTSQYKTTSSSRRSKEPAPTPDFMKEFQKKKQRNS